MATSIYFPNVISALPRPRFQAPKIPTAAIAIGAGLDAATNVGRNIIQKRQSVEQANKMADALEAEGMTQEANMYRAAAGSFSSNFFTTPDENQAFNRTVLSDAIKLLTNKQEREMKQQSLQAEMDYRKSLIEWNRNRDAIAQKEFGLRKQEMQLRSDDRNNAITQRQESVKRQALDDQYDTLKDQMKSVEDTQVNLQKLFQSGQLSRDEYERQFQATEQERLNTAKEIQRIRQSRGQLVGLDSNTFGLNFTPRPIPDLKTTEELLQSAIQSNPNAAYLSVPGAGQISMRRPQTQTQTTTENVYDANGKIIESTRRTGPVSDPVGVDPTAPGAKPSIKF